MEKYFITGSSYFIDKNIKLFTPKDDNLDLEIFFGDELNKEDFLSYINSVDLFGSPKAAIIRNAGRIKDIEHLAEIMSKCSETTLIITAPVKGFICSKASLRGRFVLDEVVFSFHPFRKHGTQNIAFISKGSAMSGLYLALKIVSLLHKTKCEEKFPFHNLVPKVF